MGFFTDNKQEELDKAAQVMFSDMTTLSKVLDDNNGVMTSQSIFYANKAEDSIVTFCLTCKKYQTTHNFVKWLGQRTMITGVLATVSGFANEIMQVTGHRFTKL